MCRSPFFILKILNHTQSLIVLVCVTQIKTKRRKEMTANNLSRISSLIVAVVMFTLIATNVSAQGTDQYNPQKAARIDACFLLDSTGSMSDEIQVVKDKIWEIVNEILLGDPKPDVRLSIVTYRDRGDVYVVNKIPFTKNVDQLHSDLMNIQADGGADKREDVNEGFRVAVNELEWDNSPGISRMVFLIGDAGPHMDYEQTVKYTETAKVATEKGIQVFLIGCSGIDTNEVDEFTQIAKLTGGQFEFLTYKMDVQQGGESKTLLITGEGAAMAPSASLEDSEWKRGSGELASKGKVSRAEVSDRVTFKDESGVERELEVGSLTNSAATEQMENNLDSVIRKQIQIGAEKQGAKYENSELKGDKPKVNGEVIAKNAEKTKRDSWYVATWNWILSLFK
jgi:uncharacterized protein YegL